MLAHSDGCGLLNMIFMFNFHLLLHHCCDISQISNTVECCLWDMSPAQSGASWLKGTNFASLGDSYQCSAAPQQQECLWLAKPCEKPFAEYGYASPGLLCHVISNTITWPLSPCRCAPVWLPVPWDASIPHAEIQIWNRDHRKLRHLQRWDRTSSDHGPQSMYKRMMVIIIMLFAALWFAPI